MPPTDAVTVAAGRASVLVVDDHALLRTGVANIINQEPDLHVVAEAGNGAEALEAYARFHHDVMLLDLSMPGGGGTEVMHHLRANFGGRVCPVIVVTGYLDSLPENLRQSLGAFAFIEKPFSMDTLRGAVRYAIRSQARS